MSVSAKPSASIRALVVDDEAPARRYLTLLLRRDPDIGSVVECGSGLEAIEEIRRSRPDLVLLDVQMPECDGFDVIELLGADLPETVIFVTAYAEYALRAFEAGALDYILKPLDGVRFSRALERAKGRLALGSPYRAHSVSRIAVKSRGQTLFLKAAEIDWIEAARYYACLHLGGGHAHRAQDPPGTRAGPGCAHIFPHPPLDHCQPRTGAGARAAGKRRVRGRAGLQRSASN